MLYDSIRNEGEYFTNYYLGDRLPDEVKRTLGKAWAKREKDREPSPRTRLGEAASAYPAARRRIIETGGSGGSGGISGENGDAAVRGKHLTQWHLDLLGHLGYEGAAERTLEVAKAGEVHEVPVLFADGGVVAVECGFAETVDEAKDPEGAGRLAEPFAPGRGNTLATGSDLASWLFTADDPPEKVLLLCGGALIFADRGHWSDGKFLGFSLDAAFARADVKGELEVIAALIAAEALLPDESGEASPHDRLVEKSRREAEGVSERLRDGLRRSVELIAGEVVKRLGEQDIDLSLIGDDREVAAKLVKESLRYLYRILFLLYAEARPELGILPVDNEEYIAGYSMARLGERVVHKLDDAERDGFHFYESLDLLFRLVNKGHRFQETVDEHTSEGRSLRFEPLRATLFEPESIRLIGRPAKLYDGYGDAEGADGADGADGTGSGGSGGGADTRLRNDVLHQVLRWLMIDDGDLNKPGRRAARKQTQFVSYAKLGIPQLGAVYEGLMSYTGKIARGETLYEVADPADIKKHGHPKKGSWLVPESEKHRYDEDVFVREEDPHTGELHKVEYKPGSFVYRLAGRERQTSASYYTPSNLAEVTVQLTLDQREKEAERPPTANEMLRWKILEPALGSGNFLNVVLDQLAERYLKKREQELGQEVVPERRQEELRKVKAYIALHNCYGVDLNSTAVELAEVSMWLNVMHKGMQSPWFGLHLREGNSLIGARREVYDAGLLRKKSKADRWLNVPPTPKHLRDGGIGEKDIHHFLLPAADWGAVAKVKEVRDLAPGDAEKLKNWRSKITAKPSEKQISRLLAISKRVEYLWDLVQRRLEMSEREIARDIDVWGLQDAQLPPENAIAKEEVKQRLEAPGTPYWRLKTLMDAWCALWFWPVTDAGLLDGTDTDGAFDQDTVTGQRPRALASLDDWIAFAEFLIGSHLPDDFMLVDTRQDSLDDLDDFEAKLVGAMGLGDWVHLPNRFGWFKRAEQIAKDQKFFHWELHYAHIFKSGGFDIQVGNPPWVRPDWDEDAVLAELEPKFVLGGWSTSQKKQRKTELLNSEAGQSYVLAERALIEGLAEFCGSGVNYPELSGTRPDLYRCFMLRIWRNLGVRGTSGLIHPDTHFVGAKEAEFRSDVYSFLRVHVHFVNERQVFEDLAHTYEYGMHIYGPYKAIDFMHLGRVFEPGIVAESISHDGHGGPPGIKFQGAWDIRPHASRCIRVTETILQKWLKLSDDTKLAVKQAKLLYPVNSVELEVVEKFADARLRFKDLQPQMSSGYNEKTAKTDELIEEIDTAVHVEDKEKAKHVASWGEVVLQGPHFSVATPFSKNPRTPCKNNTYWDARDLVKLSPSVVPFTNYVRAHGCTEERFIGARKRWVDHQKLNEKLRDANERDRARDLLIKATSGYANLSEEEVWEFLAEETKRPYTEFYRLAWRRQTPMNSERSLYPVIIPPGPSHIHLVYSALMSSSKDTVTQAGLWASLPLDYFIRISSISDLQEGAARSMPAVEATHPLVEALVSRTLRLNCLTDAYTHLWDELYENAWSEESWAIAWPGLASLAEVSPSWEWDTPLRSEFARRAALVEIDVIASLMLGISCEQLTTIYKTRYPVLADREAQTWFDADGRKICGDVKAGGYGQTKEDFAQLMEHLEHGAPAPAGYRPFEDGPSFYKADRVREYQEAFEFFERKLA